MVWEMGSIFPLTCGYPVVENIILFSLNCFGTCVQSQLTINIKVYFWTLNSIPLIHKSVLIPVPHCLDNYIFVVIFEIRKCESSNIFLFQDCLDCSKSLKFPYEFSDHFINFFKESSLDFEGVHWIRSFGGVLSSQQ